MKSQQRIYQDSQHSDNQIRERSRQRQRKGQKRRGRPLKITSNQMLDNDVQNHLYNNDQEQKYILSIQEKLIDFLQAIGENKGLIYSPTQREALKNIYKKKNQKNRKFIAWTEEQSWNRTTQIETLQRVCERQINEAIKHSIGNNSVLKRILIESGSIFAQEFTEQFYEICIQVYTIICKRQYYISHQEEWQLSSIRTSRQIQIKIKCDLDMLAHTIRTNTKKFYLMSLQFKEGIKLFQKKVNIQIDRKKAYDTLIHDLYQIMLPLVL